MLNLNNRYLGMVKQWQDMLYSGRHSQSYMESLPDFVRLAEAYGHVGIRISEPQELETKLAEALEQVRQRRLVFVDVTVDGSEHVYPMQIRGGGMDENVVEQNGEDLIMRRILSVLLENRSGALSALSASFPSVAII